MAAHDFKQFYDTLPKLGIHAEGRSREGQEPFTPALEHFDAVMNTPLEVTEETLRTLPRRVATADHLAQIPTRTEVEDALADRRESSPGADQVTVLMLRLSGELGLKILTNLMQELWQHPEQDWDPLLHKAVTTSPLSYGHKMRIGSPNVQGFADTLKLKNALLIMQKHNLDVLMLSETRSTSYYSYQSEKHLVILSGNSRDKYAGVGSIIAPQVRRHLLDVMQDSTRLLHLVFKQRGGNIHIIGAYAPHSGLDYEDIRAPFWDNLEERIAKIPQPEPVYLVGDFNVRFQAQHKHDDGVTGPYTYGKGPRFVDHSAQSNRSLCIRTMLFRNGRGRFLDLTEPRSPHNL